MILVNETATGLGEVKVATPDFIFRCDKACSGHMTVTNSGD